ncbi:MAG: hypothetical protein FD143_3636, partial [Ignavibacteria bacterium]
MKFTLNMSAKCCSLQITVHRVNNTCNLSGNDAEIVEETVLYAQ